MLLEYDWGNPAAAAAAMLLFSEDSAQDNTTQDRTNMFDHYNHGLNMDFFQQQQQQPQPISAPAALFSASNSTSLMNPNCQHRFGLVGLPPTPAAARIGLNLGVRTYFSSASPEEGMMNNSSRSSISLVAGGGGRVCRRRTRMARCQAEGCGADLTHAKHYHRRHKVCEFHSKASIVIMAGMSQRFCQQCSRFHVLTEFDQGKRSCRKRLADHNRRRRKSQDLSTASFFINSQNNNTTPPTTTANNSTNLDKSFITIAKLEASSSITHTTSPPPTLSSAMHVPPMGLGLDCGAINPPVDELSASSTTAATSPPQSISFLSQLGEFRGNESRFPIWEDGGIYENK